MRVTVDAVVCEANAVCADLVPEVFSVDESDELAILASEVPPELADRVRAAVQACPKMALLLEELAFKGHHVPAVTGRRESNRRRRAWTAHFSACGTNAPTRCR